MNLLSRLRSFLSPAPAAGPVGRNDPCPCGSGKKFKRCCIDKLEQEKLARLSAAANQQPISAKAATRAMDRVKRDRKRK